MPARPKYDWEGAFLHFVGLGPTRTYQQVADHIGSSKRTVERHGIERHWVSRAEALDRKANAKAEEVVVRERSKRIADTLRIIDASRTRFAGQLGRSDFKLTGAEFVGLVKLEQLLEGEATERISIAEVQVLLADVLRAAREVLGEALSNARLNGKSTDVVTYFDQRFPGRVAELIEGTAEEVEG